MQCDLINSTSNFPLPDPLDAFPTGPFAYDLRTQNLIGMNCLQADDDHAGTAVTWFKNFAALKRGSADAPAGGAGHLWRMGNNLLVSAAQPTDAGTYWCKAHDLATGRAVRSATSYTLKWNAAAGRMKVFKGKGHKKRGSRAAGAVEHSVLHEVQANENEPAWLACEIGGGGKRKQQQQQQLNGVGHSVKWLKDGKLLRHAELVGALEAGAATAQSQAEQTISENGRPREDCE